MSAEQVEAYLRELPRLIAQENMRMADVIAVGNGTISKQGHQRIVRRWRETIRDHEQADPHSTRLTVDEDRSKLAGFGLGVRNASQ